VADRLTITTGVLRDARRSLLGWALALGAVSFIYGAFYPAIGADQMQEMVELMPEGLASALGYDQLGSAAGYLSATVFGLLGPILLLVFAIGTGARLIAGEEEDGTLELELTHPVGRRRILAERLLALLASVVGLIAVLVAVILTLVATVELTGVTIGNVLAAALGLLLLVVAFGSLALAVGAATGRRAVGLGAAAALAGLSYVADAVGGMVEEVAWLTDVSPFSWYLAGQPLESGVDVAGFAALGGLTVVATVFALVTFARRDLGT
jgi:ABC-2 type transport system permease protein